MQRENRILILTGLALVALTMIFGFYYAVFDEHQTLAGMGIALATGFAEAASGDLMAANAALDRYGEIAREYKQEIHFHGHWGFLSVILMLMGLVVHTFNLNDGVRFRVSALFAGGAVAFPLGIALQTGALGRVGLLTQLGSALANLGVIALIIGMLAFAFGILRAS